MGGRISDRPGSPARPGPGRALGARPGPGKKVAGPTGPAGLYCTYFCII